MSMVKSDYRASLETQGQIVGAEESQKGRGGAIFSRPFPFSLAPTIFPLGLLG